MLQELTVEFAGTAFLLAAISFIGTPWAIGGALGLAALFGGAISGGHFNPAVTLWAFLSGKVGPMTAVLYVIVQSLAAASIWMAKKSLA